MRVRKELGSQLTVDYSVGQLLGLKNAKIAGKAVYGSTWESTMSTSQYVLR